MKHVMHIILLGDSVFDNAAYVAGGPAVLDHLVRALPNGWHGTLAAVDGATTAGVAGQLRRLPPDATHLVVSAGGNDALGHVGILTSPARSAAEVIGWLAAAQDEFAGHYRAMLAAVARTGLPMAVCTIYEPRFTDRAERRLANTALAVFNDVILRLAARAGIPVLDLRLVCDRDEHFANPIEPSVAGGARIAEGVVRVAREHDWTRRTTTIYG